MLPFELIQAWVQFQAVPLPIQLTVNIPGKVEDDGLSIWAPASYLEDMDETPGFSLAHPWLL